MASRGCGDNAKGKAPSGQRQSDLRSLLSQRPQMQQRSATPEPPDTQANMTKRPFPFQDRPHNALAQKRLVPTRQPAADPGVSHTGPPIRNLAPVKPTAPGKPINSPLPRRSSQSPLFYHNLFGNFPETPARLRRPPPHGTGFPKRQPKPSVDSVNLPEDGDMDSDRHGTRTWKGTGEEEPCDKGVDFGPTDVISSESFDNFMSLFNSDSEPDQGLSSGGQLQEYLQYASSPVWDRDRKFSPPSETAPDTDNFEEFDHLEGYGPGYSSEEIYQQFYSQFEAAEYQQQFKATGLGGDQAKHSADCSCSACVPDHAGLKIGRADHGADCTCSMCVPEEGGFVVHQESQSCEATHGPDCCCSICCPDDEDFEDSEGTTLPEGTGSNVEIEDSYGGNGIDSHEGIDDTPGTIYEAGSGPTMAAVSGNLLHSLNGGGTRITVYDPRTFNVMMAPRDKTFIERRKLFFTSVVRDLEEMEKRETDKCFYLMDNFQRIRRGQTKGDAINA